MILIADSGSTKTDWTIVTASHQPVVLTTQGINPIHQSREQIVQIIREEFMGRMGSHPDVQKLRSSSSLRLRLSRLIVICLELLVLFVVAKRVLLVYWVLEPTLASTTVMALYSIRLHWGIFWAMKAVAQPLVKDLFTIFIVA